MSGSVTAELADELAVCVTAKGSLRFAADEPSLRTLVATLVEAQIREIARSTTYSVVDGPGGRKPSGQRWPARRNDAAVWARVVGSPSRSSVVRSRLRWVYLPRMTVPGRTDGATTIKSTRLTRVLSSSSHVMRTAVRPAA